MRTGSSPSALNIGNYRDFLRILAGLYFRARFQARFDASDVVQETLLRAHEYRDRLEGRPDEEIKAILRTTLARTMANLIAECCARKRDIRRERQIDAVDGFSGRAESSAPAGRGIGVQIESLEGTASGVAIRLERMTLMVDSILHLPEAQREAFLLYHCEELSYGEVATRLKTSVAAVTGLIQRARRALRLKLDKPLFG
jgi:RNA polymerase sigma-70 factor (subfamily 1)